MTVRWKLVTLEGDDAEHHLTQVMEDAVRIMLPLNGKNCWMLVVEIAILFYGIFLKNSICESSGTNGTCRQKNLLIVCTQQPNRTFNFPTEVVYREINGIKLCFKGNNTHAGCCHKEDLNCSFEIRGPQSNEYSLFLSKETLSKQDIVLMTVQDVLQCMPSKLSDKSSGFLLSIDNCLEQGVKNIRLSQNDLCGMSSNYDKEACKGLAETKYKLTIGPNEKRRCVSCKPPQKISVPASVSNNGTSLENAANIMNNLSSLLEQMGSSTRADIAIGNIKGVIIKLPDKDQTNINIGITTSRDITVRNTNLMSDLYQVVQIPKEASEIAAKNNNSFAGVFFFPGINPDDPSSTFLNKETVGIEMGTEIANLSHTIKIHYRNVDKHGSIASCRSWDGKGKKTIWITDGCQTSESNDSITCHCSHLTFFAVLLSPPPQNISSADFTALSDITSIGCGLSMFFLAVALFMHFLIRKQKASQTTEILINLFVAMFTLNLSFLVNESITNLENAGACVTMAAVMHYAMLATCTWFFIEALHLYLNLWKLSTEIKHYMMKICIAGWVTPSVVVIALLSLGKYDYMVIYTDDGNSVKMCWIPDAAVHQGVNIGYYAIVFAFSFSIFIINVRQILKLKDTAENGQDISSVKANSFTILGLFLLLGITWAFAFFSHGPLLIASYYIFTILNSFQGFFLFIYYYNSSKTVRGDKSSTVSNSSRAVSKPYP